MDREINKRITYYRKKSKYTQKEVAEKLGMKSNAYSRAEREGNIPCDMAKKLADIFNIDVKQLLYENGSEDQKVLLTNILKNFDANDVPENVFPILTMDGYETQLLTMFKRCNQNKQKIIMASVYSIYKSNL